MADELLTVDEVAERLKLNPQTIRNWIDRGDLPAVRLGSRRVRVRESDLEAFLEAGHTARTGQGREELHEKLARAMADVQASLTDGSSAVELAASLETLSTAARRLAQALRAV